MAPMEEDRNEAGLHSPAGSLLEAVEAPRGLARRRIALQLVGLAIGVALLVWVCVLAFNEKNQKSLEALRHAPAWEVLLLAGLVVIGIVVNGVMFQIVLRPLKSLPVLDVTIVNAIATFLSVLPFKLGLLARALIHHRRDGLPFKTIVAWLAAFAALGLAVMIPLTAATLWRGRLDGLWWATAILGIIGCNAAGVVLGRAATRYPILAQLSLGADRIVRHPAPVIWHGVLRLADLALISARFITAAMIIDAVLTREQAVLLASSYFLLSVASPAGTLGFREMGVAAAGLYGGIDGPTVALITLVISATELVIAGAMALAGAAWLRLDLRFVRATDLSSGQCPEKE